MSADAVITALRNGHDNLAKLVSNFSEDDLARPSGAAEWDVSQVLGHLGSGAEIGLAVLQAALDGAPNPGFDFNHSVWGRWNAMTQQERAIGFLASNEALTSRYERLDESTRESLRIDLGFMPAPVDVETAGRMRLNELTLHTWDVRVAFDAGAALAPDATAALLPRSGELLGWLAKADRLDGVSGVVAVTTSDPASQFALRLDDRVSVDFDVPAKADGTLALPAEAWLRLVAGRLSPEHTPAGVTATGPADLDLLRHVFPGY